MYEIAEEKYNLKVPPLTVHFPLQFFLIHFQ
jgi:hypothetical protein